MSTIKKIRKPKTDPQATHLPCGCKYNYGKWVLCAKALQLKKAYERNFKYRPEYDKHFFNQL